jgi:ubiquinone/menaquinone biosynthesis C-methylase UbiE
VLEIGVGTGWSFRHYPAAVEEVVALEPDEGMAARAERRVGDSEGRIILVMGSAEDLPFEDASFDWAVAMLVLCTVRDPGRALREVRRVLRPRGGLLFLEHVRSAEPGLARWQDRLERPWRVVARGCHPNRDTVGAMRAAGFDVKLVEQGELPMAPRLVRPYVLGRGTARTY